MDGYYPGNYHFSFHETGSEVRVWSSNSDDFSGRIDRFYPSGGIDGI